MYGKKKYICKYCKDIFQDYQSNHRKFCSLKCKYIYFTGQKRPEIKAYCTMKGRKHTRKTKEKMRLKALGRMLSIETRLKISLKHKGKNFRENFRHKEESKIKLSQYKGPLNSQWKGGITPLSKQIRQIREYKIWRFKVFKRDNFICQRCGNKTISKHKIYLVAHHKKEFNLILREFLQQYSQFSPIEDKETLIRLAMTYEPFWDLENGETICEGCHNEELKYYEHRLIPRVIQG